MNVRLSTARTIMVGPVLDADGVAVTDLAVAAILGSKNGGAPGALNGSATLVHQHTGHYLLALTTSDISALGVMELSINSTTDAMPIKVLNVLTAAAWDAMHAASGGYIPSALQRIISTTLTETSAGYLAAAFKKLFDVVTPVLVASDVMRGTDGANTTKAGYSLADSEDVYHAEINLTIDEANTTDEYTVAWFKNGTPITSGITVPKIQVTKRADGTDLVALTAMTAIGSGMLKYDEATNRTTAGQAATVIVTATIDAATRTWREPLGRDSSA